MEKSTVKKKSLSSCLVKSRVKESMKNYYYIYNIPLRDLMDSMDEVMHDRMIDITRKVIQNYLETEGNMDWYTVTAYDIISHIYRKSGPFVNKEWWIVNFLTVDMFQRAAKF